MHLVLTICESRRNEANLLSKSLEGLVFHEPYRNRNVIIACIEMIAARVLIWVADRDDDIFGKDNYYISLINYSIIK